MIFSLFTIYRQVKQGTQDPTGFAAEEVQGLFLDAILLPGIILLIVTILLGILSFSSWIIEPTLVAKIFFWIFLIITLIYGFIVSVIKVILGRILKRGKSYVDKKIINIKNR